MKMPFAAVLVAVTTAASLCLADSASNPAQQPAPPSTQKAIDLSSELQKACQHLSSLEARLTALEKEVNSLKAENARLAKEIKEATQPRLRPLDNK